MAVNTNVALEKLPSEDNVLGNYMNQQIMDADSC